MIVEDMADTDTRAAAAERHAHDTRESLLFGGVYGAVLACSMVAALTQYGHTDQESRRYDAVSRTQHTGAHATGAPPTDAPLAIRPCSDRCTDPPLCPRRLPPAVGGTGASRRSLPTVTWEQSPEDLPSAGWVWWA